MASKVTGNVEILLVINTDGEFDFRNKDGFFTEDWESYIHKRIVPMAWLEQHLDAVILEMRSRVFSSYAQKGAIIDQVQDIEWGSDVNGNPSNLVEDIQEDSVVEAVFMAGNRDIRIQLSRVEEVEIQVPLTISDIEELKKVLGMYHSNRTLSGVLEKLQCIA